MAQVNHSRDTNQGQDKRKACIRLDDHDTDVSITMEIESIEKNVEYLRLPYSKESRT